MKRMLLYCRSIHLLVRESVWISEGADCGIIKITFPTRTRAMHHWTLFSKGRIVLIILSVLGMAAMGYLLSLRFAPEGDSFCNLGEGLSCDIVNKSEYATILGIPMSLLGLLYFLGVGLLALFRYNEATLRTIAFVTIVFLGPSLYLTGVELFVIHNICVFCEFSKVLMLLIMGIAFAAAGKKLAGKAVASAVVLALLSGLVTYAVQGLGVPREKYNEFAMCLTEKRLVMYGSMTCQACAKQRRMFGDAFQYVKEIECDPRNEGYVPGVCEPKNIEKTPTWILLDEAGNDVFRFDAGVQELEKLSEVSGCPLPEEE